MPSVATAASANVFFARGAGLASHDNGDEATIAAAGGIHDVEAAALRVAGLDAVRAFVAGEEAKIVIAVICAVKVEMLHAEVRVVLDRHVDERVGEHRVVGRSRHLLHVRQA